MRGGRLAVLAAVSTLVLASCGEGGEGRLDGAAGTRPVDSEVRVGESGPLDVGTTVPPEVVVVPDKPGAANCRLIVRPVGCFDTYQQLVELLGGGTRLVNGLNG